MEESKARFLVIDDEAIVCRNCKRILTEEGYEVFTETDPEEALRVMKEEVFDIVIVDLKMPKISGLDVLAGVKEIEPDTEVIIITGYSTVKSAVEAMKQGAFDYVPKPFTSDELLLPVHNALEKRKLVLENRELRERLKGDSRFRNIVGKSEPMKRVFQLISEVAPTDSTVLIRGESGTGKELIASAIHELSPRKQERFLPVDCAALSENLLESELFGHVKGAFTGADSPKPGLFEVANGGTLFLDEIGNISLSTQAKLLRVLQEQEIRPVGSVESRKVDVRIIAATNKELEDMIADETFREDLFYRLNIFPIVIPPLRERKDDIPLLAMHFLGKYRRALGRKVNEIDPKAMVYLQHYDWPGNVREMENVMNRIVLIKKDNVVYPRDLPGEIVQRRDEQGREKVPVDAEELKNAKKRARESSVEDIEKTFVLEALKRNDWIVSRAARDVKMHRSNFQSLMKKYDIKSDGFPS
jgi:DNA-binding NtrC family response regulator